MKSVAHQTREVVEELAADGLLLVRLHRRRLRSFSAASASFFAFSSLYTPKPMEDRKLKKMLTPQVTGRVLSKLNAGSSVSLAW